MDLKYLIGKAKQLDVLLTHTGELLKKHWKLIVLGLIVWFVYWAFNLPPVIEEDYPIYDSTNYYEDTLIEQI